MHNSEKIMQTRHTNINVQYSNIQEHLKYFWGSNIFGNSFWHHPFWSHCSSHISCLGISYLTHFTSLGLIKGVPYPSLICPLPFPYPVLPLSVSLGLRKGQGQTLYLISATHHPPLNFLEAYLAPISVVVELPVPSLTCPLPIPYLSLTFTQ